jgi:hypothetical protein
LETLLHKKNALLTKTFVEENFSNEVNLEVVTSYFHDLTKIEVLTKPVSLKNDWMVFIDGAMATMHSKISF